MPECNHGKLQTIYKARKLLQILEEVVSSIRGDASLAFSGGIDSTLLMHLSGYRFSAITVGTEGSRDFQNSEKVSRTLGFPVTRVIISESTVRMAIDDLRSIDPEINVTELGYESVLYIALRSSGHRMLITGQGSDELFYGYHKYLEGRSSNREDLDKLMNITLPREVRIAESVMKKLITPYLDPRVLQFASGLNRDECISGQRNKVILREAARLSGLPPDIVENQKKAAQYGSGTMKIIRKILRT